MARLTVYHKPCLQCVFDDWHLVENWARNNDIKLKTRRTEYNPIWHQFATSIWGDEMYPPFITDGKNFIAIEFAIEKIKGKGVNDLQELFGAKKRARKSRKVVEIEETNEETKEEVE